MTTQSPSIATLAAALVKAQAALKPALKDSSNPFFKSKYADLGSVWDACRDALHANGLSVVQFPGFESGEARLTTILLHTSGEWLSGVAGAPLAKADAQSVGSALSYLRRYALSAVVGVVTEDDDGNSASGRDAPATSKRAPAPRPKAPSPNSEPTGDLKEASVIKRDMIRAAITRAGVKGADWPVFYRTVTGREYAGKIYEVDVKPLLDAVAGGSAKSAGESKDDASDALQGAPSPVATPEAP